MSGIEQLSLWTDEYTEIADELQRQTEHDAQRLQARLEASPLPANPLWAPEPVEYTLSSRQAVKETLGLAKQNFSAAARGALMMGDGPINEEAAAIADGIRYEINRGIDAASTVISTVSEHIPSTANARRALVSVGLAGAVMVGATGIDNTISQQDDARLIVQRTTDNTILDLGDISNQDIQKSYIAAANASGIAPEDQEVKDGKLYLPPTVNEAQLKAIYIAFLAPDSVPTTTTTSQPEKSAEKSKDPEVKVETPAEIEALNTALEKIDINAPAIDMTEVVLAAQAVDRLLAPTDKDRLPNMPAGYVKVWLPSEADGLNVPFTPGQRTADVERYTSPQSAAVQYVMAKMYQQLITEKYPHLAGDMLRLRDSNSPHHKTHNDGRQVDVSGSLGWEVTQYADGAFADYQFSDRYDHNFTRDMAILSAKLTIDGESVISSILYSDKNLVNEVNGALGYEFMDAHDDYHQDHFHITLKKMYALPQWRPRAPELPWGGEPDLRIAGMAREISQDQHDSQHKDHEWWAFNEMLKNGAITLPPATPEATVPIEAKPETIHDEQLSPEAEKLIAGLDLTDEQKNFLRKMVPGIAAVYKSGAQINPAVVLAQTSLETGFGRDNLSQAANNYFGMKAGPKWTGEVYHAPTKEEYVEGQVVEITDGFRKYPNVASSVQDYADLIQNAPHYADAVMNYQSIEGYTNGLFNEVDATGKIIKEQGESGVLSYGTDRGYEQKVFEVIARYGYGAIIDAQLQQSIPATPQTPAMEPQVTVPVETEAPKSEPAEVAPEDALAEENSPTETEPEKVPEPTPPTQTPVQPVTTTPDLEVETIEIDPLSWFDAEKTKHIYEPYFEGNSDALEEWVNGLPQQEVDGEIKFQVNINRIPEVKVQDNEQ